jgi:hypothetical protein
MFDKHRRFLRAAYGRRRGNIFFTFQLINNCDVNAAINSERPFSEFYYL